MLGEDVMYVLHEGDVRLGRFEVQLMRSSLWLK